MSIPKIISFIWLGPPMPWWARVNIKRFKRLNPEFQCRVHGEEILDERYRPGYEAINGDHSLARKSDLLRISALIKTGGWYFDCDFFPIRPLRDLYRDYSDFPAECFLTRTSPCLITNSIIGTSPSSRFFRIVERRIRYLAFRTTQLHWGGFGPALFTQVAQHHSKAVHIGETDMFHPFAMRQASLRAYRQLAQADFADDAIHGILDCDGALPYMFHLTMMDELLLRNAMEV